MASSEIRIGIVGAGQITRSRHFPGFKAIPGVRVVAVCNRHRESARRIASEFDIPKVHGSWEDLVGDPNCRRRCDRGVALLALPSDLAAFDAGKHVLTQARMAMNAREAQRMLDRSLELPRLTAMIVPSPYGLAGDAFMRSLIDSGYLGKLREVHVHSLSDQLADAETPMSWRQITKYSGFNMLTLGIVYETVLRWVAPATRVLAYASKIVRERFDPEQGKKTKVGTPDSVQVVTTQALTARAGSTDSAAWSGMTRRWELRSMATKEHWFTICCGTRFGVGSVAPGVWSRFRFRIRNGARGESRRISSRRSVVSGR